MDVFVKVLNMFGTGCGVYVFYKLVKIAISKKENK